MVDIKVIDLKRRMAIKTLLRSFMLDIIRYKNKEMTLDSRKKHILVNTATKVLLQELKEIEAPLIRNISKTDSHLSAIK